jgi:tyrosinase
MANRVDIASLPAGPGGWPDALVWYARAVRALQAKPITDPTSWRYLGAIHGFDRSLWVQRGLIQPTDPLPPNTAVMWNQCQHQGWWFAPWHRGYLASFEAIIASTIASLGGPANWKLPYWNYLNAQNPTARNFPKPFLDANLPDGTPNPLSRVPRGTATVLGPTPWFPRDITLNCMQVPVYTSQPGALGFGGGITAFQQFGGRTGALEDNPHNAVHVIIGGPSGGFMSDPRLAGLDPIFWIHHCNIDRLWSAWMSRPQNRQEQSAAFRNGPAPRQFTMPTAGGRFQVFTPGQTLPGGPLAPTYDNINSGTQVVAVRPLAMAAAANEEPVMAAAEDDAGAGTLPVLAGANARRVTVGAGPVRSRVAMDRGGGGLRAMAAAAAPAGPVRTYLNLEQIKGKDPSGVLTVRLSRAGAGDAAAAEVVDTVALFGLAVASSTKGPHGGNGITITIDVTDQLRALGGAGGITPDKVDVHLEQPGVDGVTPGKITVDRISFYTVPENPGDATEGDGAGGAGPFD